MSGFLTGFSIGLGIGIMLALTTSFFRALREIPGDDCD